MLLRFSCFLLQGLCAFAVPKRELMQSGLNKMNSKVKLYASVSNIMKKPSYFQVNTSFQNGLDFPAEKPMFDGQRVHFHGMTERTEKGRFIIYECVEFV